MPEIAASTTPSLRFLVNKKAQFNYTEHHEKIKRARRVHALCQKIKPPFGR
jgi:hypothetical protein